MQMATASFCIALLVGLAVAAVDARAWRTRLSTFGEVLMTQTQARRALTFAVAGIEEPGAAIAIHGDRAEGLLTRLGGARIWGEFDSLNGVRADGSGNVVVMIDHEDRATLVRLDTETISELGRIKITSGGFELTFDGTHLVASGPDRRLLNLDLATGELTEIDSSATRWGISWRGSQLIWRGDDSIWKVRDLGTKAFRSVGVLGQFNEFVLSTDGAQLISKSGFVGDGVLHNLTSGTVAPLKVARGYGLSPNSKYLFTIDADDRGTLHDLQTGTITDLPGGWAFAFSPDSSRLMIARDAVIVRDLISGANEKIEAIGRWEVIHDQWGAAGLVSFDTEEKATLRFPVHAVLGDATGGVSLSPDRSVAVTFDGTMFATAHDLGTGRRAPLAYLGAETPVVLGNKFLIGRDGNRTIIRDVSRNILEGARSGRARAVAVCRASGRAIHPFSSYERLPRARADIGERRVFEALHGRPWNPCDWRGLFALFPDPERGDGWFEGLRQWSRLMLVRNVGARDYECAEATSAASDVTRAHRMRMCNLYDAPAPAGGGPT